MDLRTEIRQHLVVSQLNINLVKAFLLAAGHGTRLRPITDQIPKCLVPIRGVPMLRIWMDICAKAGIDEVMNRTFDRIPI